MEMITKKPVDQESMKYCEKELENYKSTCVVQLDERGKKWEERCAALEVDIGSKNSEYDVLDLKFKALDVEKIAVEYELKVLKRKNNELEERVVRTEKRLVDLTFENEEKMVQLIIENRVLECEKKRAQDEVEIWKKKVQYLESKLELGSRHVGSLERINATGIREVSKPKYGVSSDNVQTKEKLVGLEPFDETFCVSPGEGIGLSPVPGTPSIDTPYKHIENIKGEKRGTHLDVGLGYGSHAKKQLAYENEGRPNIKIDPSTSIGVRPTSASVSIIDSEDDEPDIALKRTLSDQNYEEDSNVCEGNLTSSRTPKRKRASQIVTTDSESDDDDNVVICKLKRPHYLQEPIHDLADSHFNIGSTGANGVTRTVTPPRRPRRLVTLKQREEGSGAEQNYPSNIKPCGIKYELRIPTTKEVEDDETEELGSDSEGESLGGFIVNSSSDSEISGGSEKSDVGDNSSESESESNSNMGYDEIISGVKRNRDDKLNWEFEGDMLAAFGKNAELCLKAVCALYRQQTSDEILIKGTIHSNKRGFSQCDAPRGTTLAEFLLDGEIDLKKSVEELKAYDPYAVEQCRTLATRYSKQLFEIYKNKEDPYFRPSWHGLP